MNNYIYLILIKLFIYDCIIYFLSLSIFQFILLFKNFGLGNLYL